MSLWDQMTGKQKAALGLVVAAAFLGLGYVGTRLGSDQDRVSVVTDGISPSDEVERRPVDVTQIKVYVSGAVRRPGVYELNSDRLIQDALYLAGGPMDGADLDRVNLAGRMVDTMQIHVPWLGDPVVEGLGNTETPSVVSINMGSREQLMSLPNVGEKTADAIIKYRTENGPFERVEDLAKVDGIGEKTLEKLLGRISL